jgi:rhodanese-related sulfurtransferase
MSDLPLEVSCAEVKTQLDTGNHLVLVDCREQHEFNLVAIDGAVLLPMSETPARVGELEAHRGRPILVYCHHGMRSAQVAVWLRGQGFTQAQSMSGGIDRWAVEIEPGMPRY